MRAPAEFCRLHAFGQKAFDRPGVDEHIARLRALGALGVALGDMHALDAEALRAPGPFVARLWLGALLAEVGGEIDERLLDEPGHHAGIGPAAGDGCRPARVPTPLLEHRLAQGVIGARLVAEIRGVIEAGPGLDHRVDVERADLAAIAHDVERRGVDREIDAEALSLAGPEMLSQDLAIIVLGKAELDELHAALVEQTAVRVVRIDDDEALLVEGEMALDQGKGSLADRTESNHHDRAFDAPVEWPLRHGVLLPQFSYASVAQASEPPLRREATKQSRTSEGRGGSLNCFASLAMTKATLKATPAAGRQYRRMAGFVAQCVTRGALPCRRG